MKSQIKQLTPGTNIDNSNKNKWQTSSKTNIKVLMNHKEEINRTRHINSSRCRITNSITHIPEMIIQVLKIRAEKGMIEELKEMETIRKE
jgi:hypothetical protein